MKKNLAFWIPTLFSVLTSNMAAGQEKSCPSLTIKQCPSYFSERCSTDAEFKREHPRECFKIRTNSAPPDQDFCSGAAKVCNRKAQTNSLDCESITSFRERKTCEVRKSGLPSCLKSVNANELVFRFQNLSAKIDGELASYGELLDWDIDKVNPDELCKTRFETIERYYIQASQKDSPVVGFIEESKDISSCQAEVEDWMNRVTDTTIVGTIDVDLVDQLRFKMEDLPTIQTKLERDVSKLKSASVKLDKIAERHIVFCSPIPIDPD